jgi:hypothetical protein
MCTHYWSYQSLIVLTCLTPHLTACLLFLTLRDACLWTPACYISQAWCCCSCLMRFLRKPPGGAGPLAVIRLWHECMFITLSLITNHKKQYSHLSFVTRYIFLYIYTFLLAASACLHAYTSCWLLYIINLLSISPSDSESNLHSFSMHTHQAKTYRSTFAAHANYN